jgi:hypothetical protein
MKSKWNSYYNEFWVISVSLLVGFTMKTLYPLLWCFSPSFLILSLWFYLFISHSFLVILFIHSHFSFPLCLNMEIRQWIIFEPYLFGGQWEHVLESRNQRSISWDLPNDPTSQLQQLGVGLKLEATGLLDKGFCEVEPRVNPILVKPLNKGFTEYIIFSSISSHDTRGVSWKETTLGISWNRTQVFPSVI